MQSIGPVVVPNRPPPVQTVSVTGVKPQVPARLTVVVGRGPERPSRYGASNVGAAEAALAAEAAGTADAGIGTSAAPSRAAEAAMEATAAGRW
jgi:hypothetical protein